MKNGKKTNIIGTGGLRVDIALLIGHLCIRPIYILRIWEGVVGCVVV